MLTLHGNCRGRPEAVAIVDTCNSEFGLQLRLLALASSRKFHNATILRTTPFMAFIHAHTSARPSFRLPSRLSPHVTRIYSLEFLQKSKLEPPRRRPQRTYPIRGQGQAGNGTHSEFHSNSQYRTRLQLFGTQPISPPLTCQNLGILYYIITGGYRSTISRSIASVPCRTRH